MVSVGDHTEDLKKDSLFSSLHPYPPPRPKSELSLVLIDPYPLVYEPKLSNFKNSFWLQV